MNRLRDLPIAGKLGAGLGAVIVLMVLIALTAVSRLGASDADTRYVGANALPSVELIAGVKTSAFDYHGVALEEVLAVDPEEMPELDGELEAAATNVSKSLERYRGLVSDARDRALYEKTASAWRTYLSKLDGFTGRRPQAEGRRGLRAARQRRRRLRRHARGDRQVAGLQRQDRRPNGPGVPRDLQVRPRARARACCWRRPCWASASPCRSPARSSAGLSVVLDRLRMLPRRLRHRPARRAGGPCRGRPDPHGHTGHPADRESWQATSSARSPTPSTRSSTAPSPRSRPTTACATSSAR